MESVSVPIPRFVSAAINENKSLDSSPEEMEVAIVDNRGAFLRRRNAEYAPVTNFQTDLNHDQLFSTSDQRC